MGLVYSEAESGVIFGLAEGGGGGLVAGSMGQQSFSVLMLVDGEEAHFGWLEGINNIMT